MSICQSNVIYRADEPIYFGSHMWKLVAAERIFKMPPRKEWHPTTWYGRIGKFFWVLLGGDSQDIFDIEWTGQVKKVYYCYYCREKDEVVTQNV